MTSFSQFSANCRMRYDFSDQIQVRYRHTDGEDYDTWVSGEEVLRRLHSEAAEKRLKGIGELDWQQIRDKGQRLPNEGEKMIRRSLRDWLADSVGDAIGGNLIGNSLADSISGVESDDPYEAEGRLWRERLEDEGFRAKVLELAWIQLEGSFPSDSPADERDDWL